MEHAVQEFTSALDEAERKLNDVNSQVDATLNESQQSGSTVKLLAQVEELRKDFSQVKQEVDALKSNQEEVMSSILKELTSAMTLAEKLQNDAEEVPKDINCKLNKNEKKK